MERKTGLSLVRPGTEFNRNLPKYKGNNVMDVPEVPSADAK